MTGAMTAVAPAAATMTAVAATMTAVGTIATVRVSLTSNQCRSSHEAPSICRCRPHARRRRPRRPRLLRRPQWVPLRLATSSALTLITRRRWRRIRRQAFVSLRRRPPPLLGSSSVPAKAASLDSAKASTTQKAVPPFSRNGAPRLSGKPPSRALAVSNRLSLQ
jgi:hypothetical protein